LTSARRLIVLGAVLLLASGCVDVDVRRIGPARPSRPPACNVDVIAEGRPGYDFVDVASANVSCARTRDRCLDELRKQACVVGADALYGFSERTESMYIHMTVTLAARK
jgi:hypothetical protein